MGLLQKEDEDIPQASSVYWTNTDTGENNVTDDFSSHTESKIIELQKGKLVFDHTLRSVTGAWPFTQVLVLFYLWDSIGSVFRYQRTGQPCVSPLQA